MRPRLKDVFWERSGAELRLIRDAHEQLRLDDPDGMVELLLDLLFKGSRTPPELAEVVGVPVARGPGRRRTRPTSSARRRRTGRTTSAPTPATGTPTIWRFSIRTRRWRSVARTCSKRLRTAHVLLLGLGGVNMTAAAQLCGLARRPAHGGRHWHDRRP